MTDKTSVDDIIGIVKTEEPTNSVQLKKEAQLSICEKRVRELEKENEQLKQSVNNLKDTIVTIGIAYQRKYDRTLVDLVDEVHDEDITDLIKGLEND